MKVSKNTVIELSDTEAEMLEAFITNNADLSLYDESQPMETKITKFALQVASYLTR